MAAPARPSNLLLLRNRRIIFADPTARLAGRALRHHDAACVRPGPGQTGNVTPVSSSETVHRRRWMAVSRDRPLDSASFGEPPAHPALCCPPERAPDGQLGGDRAYAPPPL